MKLTAEAEHLIDQLGIISSQFEFYEKECCKLDVQAQEIQALDEDITSRDTDKLDAIIKKLDELYARYQRDRETYAKLITQTNNYFKTKYGVNFNLDELI
jgi:DNA gyrase/topoisomerase IV subunit A